MGNTGRVGITGDVTTSVGAENVGAMVVSDSPVCCTSVLVHGVVGRTGVFVHDVVGRALPCKTLNGMFRVRSCGWDCNGN